MGAGPITEAGGVKQCSGQARTCFDSTRRIDRFRCGGRAAFVPLGGVTWCHLWSGGQLGHYALLGSIVSGLAAVRC